MKIIKAIALILFIALGTSAVQAQKLSKSEKKRLKKEIKAYKKDPITYKQMKDRNKSEIEERDETIEALTAQLDALNEKNKALSDSISALMGRYSAIMNELKNQGKPPKGTVYAVQIGYFQLLDLQGFNQKARFIKAEDVDGAKRYVIGYFTDLNDAVQFGEDVKTIGIKDAFVSQYIDGERNMEFDALKVK